MPAHGINEDQEFLLYNFTLTEEKVDSFFFFFSLALLDLFH